jgi:hypothetical protein
MHVMAGPLRSKDQHSVHGPTKEIELPSIYTNPPVHVFKGPNQDFSPGLSEIIVPGSEGSSRLLQQDSTHSMHLTAGIGDAPASRSVLVTDQDMMRLIEL